MTSWPLRKLHCPGTIIRGRCGGCDTEFQHDLSIDYLGSVLLDQWQTRYFTCDACGCQTPVETFVTVVVEARGGATSVARWPAVEPEEEEKAS